MTIELKKNGYKKLEKKIQEIESQAHDGIYVDRDIRDMALRFQQIAQEARSLRQLVREITLMAPDRASGGGRHD
jgi:cystathionine beta-lyase/cystathionine gamma-synthase